MKLRHFGFALITMPAAVAGVWLGACGGTTSNGGTTAAPVGEDAFAAQFANAVCGADQGCCAQNNVKFNATNCTTAVQGLIQAAINDQKAKGTGYDANAAGDCIAKTRADVQACAPTTSSGQMTPTQTACDAVFPGTAKPGDSCDTARCAPSPSGRVECIHYSSSSPDGGTSTSGSICQLLTPAKAGDPCGGSATPPPATAGDCDFQNPSFRCDFTTNTCKPKANLGEPCSGTGDCVAAAFCSNQICVVKVAAGGSCAQAPFDACDASSFCDEATQKCLAKKPAGAACASTNTEQCAGTCSSGTCISSSYADPTICGGG